MSQKDKNTSCNYYQEHIGFWCNVAIAEEYIQSLCSILHVRCFGTLRGWGGCKCISSMPNVCYAGQHWFSHKFDNDNYFMFSSRVCLKEQLSIFITQAMLELPKVARSSHGNTFILGLSPLAGILLTLYCHLTATCVHLFTVYLYPSTCKTDISIEMSLHELDRLNSVCTYMIKAVFNTSTSTSVFGTCTGPLCHSGKLIFMV